MHFQYLVEDISGENLIRVLMDKYVQSYPDVTYDCKSFHGIGGFTKKNTVKETKTGKLLNDLATYLRGFNKSLQNFPAVIVVHLIFTVVLKWKVGMMASSWRSRWSLYILREVACSIS